MWSKDVSDGMVVVWLTIGICEGVIGIVMIYDDR